MAAKMKIMTLYI